MKDSLNAVSEITACIWWFSFILGTVSMMVALNESFVLWGCWLVSILMIPGDSNQESFGATCSEWHDHESSVSHSWVLWKGTVLQDLCLQWATPWIYDFTPFSSTLMLVLGWESSSIWMSLLYNSHEIVGYYCGVNAVPLVYLITFNKLVIWVAGIGSWCYKHCIRFFQFMTTKDMFLNTWCILIRFFSIL